MTQEDENVSLYLCPCCGRLTLHELDVYEICEICGWEDDPVQSRDPTYSGGANASSLLETQAIWKRQIRSSD
ncbi:CPCC family cysteine-rich protein [Achromobacter xylosoxidans]|uniref:CPCC family cysteine-rich protein n=1 Tax=Alcaligenes xylosoxydans xylosoxydans TaxID=85698 RepID=A0A9X3KVE4_ALCXX|nr:CPCC family cysteine-rich protein [Achromobacter xylosoxidans]MCZ8400604.1 CPCC family cysteine-rich protein [Achromobacter xylosoxidans]